MENKKYYLFVNGKKEKVSKEVYKEYWKIKNRENYLKRQDVKYCMMPFSSVDQDGHFANNISDDSVDIEKIIQKKIMIEDLNNALKQLTIKERELIKSIYYNDESLRCLARLYKISQPALLKRRNKWGL